MDRVRTRRKGIPPTFLLAPLLVCAAFMGGRPAMGGQGGLLEQEAVVDLAASFNDPWRWVQFKTASGLPSNSVYDVVETPSGTVWAATQRGLAWYDGFRWHEMGAAQGIPAVLPRAIATYGDDEIVAAVERRLYRGDRDGLEEVPVEVDGTAYDALSVRKAAANGSFLLAATDRDSPIAVLYYDGATARHLSPRTEARWDQHTIDAWSNGAGALWMSAVTGLERWEGGRWEKAIGSPGDLPLNVRRLVETEENTGLASIGYPPEARGLWEWTAGSVPRLNRREPADLLESMDVSPTGDAIVVYRSGDVRVRRDDRWSRIEQVPPQLAGLLFVKFRSDGDLWVGTQDGLFLFRASHRRWTHWEVPSPDVCNEILEILPARDGSVWLATGRGIAIHGTDGTVDWIERIEGTELQEITGLAQDDQGFIWVSSGSALPGAYRGDGQRWTHFGAAEGLLAPLVHRIRKDSSGRLWFLGIAKMLENDTDTNQPGAFVFENGEFTPWTTAEGLIHGRVYDFAEGTDGALWFATFGGLSRWHDGEWSHWTTTDGLRKGRIFTVAVDNDNRLWFGDQSSGLGFIDEHGQPGYFTTADGLIHDEVQELQVAPGGELWISTRGGLSRLHDGNWLSFDVTTGLSSPILWPILPLEGRVFIGTSGNGLDVLDLAEADLPEPVVQVTATVFGERSALLRWEAHAYWGQLPPEAIETRYRLDDAGWSDWSTSREAVFTAMAPGEHVFEIQAQGVLGGFEASGQRIPLAIRPPFYFRPNFYVPVGALVLLVVLLLTGRRRHALTLRQRDEEYRRRLEERVDERTDALRESEERLRMLLETAHVIPWVADATSWKFTYVGPQAVDILGYPIERWYEPTFWADHIHPEDVDGALEYYEQQSSVNDRYELEYRMLTADGVVVWLHDIVAVVHEEGKPAMLRGFMIDVTARKQAEAERIEAESETLEHRERLAHLSRVNMLGEMATGIAHEVNQPLTAVSTYTQACRRLIEADLIDEVQIIDVLGRISDEAVRAGDMIHGLKALVRKRSSELRICNVNELVHEVIPLAEVEARDLGIQIRLQLSGDVPDIAADDVQIQQVILNLIRNAIEATESGTGDVTVCSTLVDGDVVKVEVADNGAGIDHDDPEQVFQPFFSTKRDGMGMGLSISRSIIEAHGGQIGYCSGASGGSTFFFRLPAEHRALVREA